MPSRISERDFALINFAFENAQTSLVAFGKVESFAILENDAGERVFVQSGGFFDTSDKDEFAQICQVAAAAHKARATAIVGESWKVTSVEDTERPHLDKLWRQGKLGEHPNATECVSLILECDLGLITVCRGINRAEPLWPVLNEAEDGDIEVFPAGDQSFDGRFKRMLIPREAREQAAEQAAYFLGKMGVRLISPEEFSEVTVRPQA